MIKYKQIFDSLPFPFFLICKETNKVILKNSNSFFDESANGIDENHFTRISQKGWSTCPRGYAAYTQQISSKKNTLLVLHTLKVKPFWKQQGKSNFFTVVTEQTKVERFVSNFLKNYEDIIDAIENEKNEKIRSFAIESIHEIRSINSSLYNIGFELQEKLQYDRHHLALAKNVVALSELISTRIELTDISISENEEDILKKSSPVPVFKLFDKIIRCYIAYAAKRKITFKLEGTSRSQTLGLEHFELIPMILIDNAVKYSPNGKEIKVIFNEDADFIKINLISLGPKINQDEENKIFEKSYRGRNAVQSGKKGSGIGLYFVGKLMESINSDISVLQEENPINLDRKTFYSTNFQLLFRRQNS